jgi:death-on-curing protein
MIRFSREKVLLLHQLLAQETGGSIGVRDEALLDAALENSSLALAMLSFIPPKKRRAHGWVTS